MLFGRSRRPTHHASATLLVIPRAWLIAAQRASGLLGVHRHPGRRVAVRPDDVAAPEHLDDPPVDLDGQTPVPETRGSAASASDHSPVDERGHLG
ncbi:hypothetical protein PUR61_09570, partial [Streptomyces sp. BE20]|uniref:hypothetical protein n=1 Tax=Streptomyces sp. BE20 TaxID=3002525 RepID=UPI002E75E186